MMPFVGFTAKALGAVVRILKATGTHEGFESVIEVAEDVFLKLIESDGDSER